MNSLEIFWWNGQHASDLQERWIFNWFNIDIIEKWEWSWSDFCDKAIITPISTTKETIENIVAWWTIWSLTNFSWIMSTTPEKVKKTTSNLHFLFWPEAKKWLNLVTAGNLSETTLKIIDNSRKAWIKIIESNIDEHDDLMARIQWLTHLFILLSWLNTSWTSKIIKEWKTPSWTIADMIFSNPFFKQVFNDFNNSIWSLWVNISKKMLEMTWDLISNKQQNDFWTPTFNRVQNFCKKNDLFVNQEILDFLKNGLLDREILEEKIKDLQMVEVFTKLKN